MTRSLSDIDLSTATNDRQPPASFSARKNPQCIPANTLPVFPGLRPRIWPPFLRLVTNGNVGQAPRRDRRFHRRRAYRPLVCLGLVSILGGCATDKDVMQKSQGHYQEGVASLPGDRQKAFVSFQKAVQLNPANKEARYALGHVYARQGKLSFAEEQFRAAIKIDETYSEAHTYLGQVLANQDRWDEAIQSYRQALANSLNPTPDIARFHLGRALAHRGDLQGAMEALEDAVSASPPSVPPAMTHLELGRVYYKMGYMAKARDILEKVATLDKGGGELAAAAADLLTQLE